MTDPVARQWQTVQINHHSLVLENFGIDQKQLVKASETVLETADKLLKEQTRWQNHLSNIEADIRLNNQSEKTLYRVLLKMQTDCRELNPLLANLRESRKILTTTADLIQKNLSLNTIFTLAQNEAAKLKKQKTIFEAGLELFRTLTNDQDCQDRDNNIHTLIELTERIELKFTKIVIPEMPELAKVVVYCHIDTCLSAALQINNFVSFMQNTFKSEMDKVAEIKLELLQLKEKSFSIILSSLKEESTKLKKVINEFYYKAHLIEEMKKINLLLDYMQVFYESLRYFYLPSLSKRTMEPNSTLHPYLLAETFGKKYFSGLKGLMRLLKLQLFAKAEPGSSHLKLLTEKIYIALSTCPYYYCSKETDTQKMIKFIEKLVHHLKKPFPYEDFFLILKKSIALYGSMIEKDFISFQAERKPPCAENASKPHQLPSPKIQLGRLISKIEVHTQHLQKLQTG
ncbi:MAG: hypothetical protein KQH63_08350 [Desulfobulbaceae bacterium]|nr:hypothetical protein [Desulfobulbaceae bacterium]